jgi:regulator of RNase E activity RraA
LLCFFLNYILDRQITSQIIQVFARATSTVGTGAAAKSGAREVPVTVGEVTVHPVSAIPSVK